MQLQMKSERKPMTSKKFFDEDEIEDIDPASEYENGEDHVK